MATTIGNGTGGFEHLPMRYRWKKHPDWTPNHPKYREPIARTGDAAAMSEARAGRLTEFARLRNDEGLNITEAGRALGVAVKTAQTYNRECKSLGLIRSAR